MGILKRRPDVELRGPKVIPVGSSCRLKVTVSCPAAVDVAGITLELVGHVVPIVSGRRRSSGWSVGAQLSRYVAQLVSEPCELAEGDHEYPVEIHLPRGTPGSYAGRSVVVEWTCRVHVDIPWWPDRRAAFSINVAGEGVQDTAAPEVFVSDLRGPQGRGPYSEVSLASTTIEPGGHLVGQIALSNVDSNRYRELRFALAAKETHRGYTTVDRPARWVQRLEEPDENETIPFRLQLPPALTPAFQAHGTALAWQLELELDVAWARNPIQWIPLEIGATQRSAEDAAVVEASPLAVGSERLAQVWRRAAAASGFDYADDRLACLIDGRRLEIRREHGGRRGVSLVAEADLRPVDIGLFTDKGRLRCRDEQQSRLLGAATDALGRELGLNAASDDRVRLSIANAGIRSEPLAAFAKSSAKFVRAFVEARADLPPPADAAHLEETLVKVARAAGGTLQRAGMDVFGVRDEVPFSVETRWDGRGALSCFAITVRPLIPVDARFHGNWHGAEKPAELPEGLGRVADGAAGLAVDEESIEVFWPPDPELLEKLLDRVERLIAVGLALSMRAGGYR